MDEKEKIKYWLDLAEYDIEVAQSLYQSKKFLYVGFLCHLIIEKTLKAFYWFKLKSEPTYTHNLVLLSERTSLIKDMTDENINLLNTLMPLNIEGRYPIDKQMLLLQLKEPVISEILTKTLSLQKWIKKLIKN
jgi:HEPN domain-containing protein